MKAKSPYMHFGKTLADAQQAMLDKNLAKAAAKKAKLDAKLAPQRLARIRLLERRRYAAAKALTLAEQKAEDARLTAERRAAREAKKQAKAQALFMESQKGTFRALHLNTGAEQSAYLKIRDILPAVLVSRLAQGGFVQPECVSEALDYLRTASAPHLV
jgi:hypothetical protein